MKMELLRMGSMTAIYKEGFGEEESVMELWMAEMNTTV